MSVRSGEGLERSSTLDFRPESSHSSKKPPREAQYLISRVGPALKAALCEITSVRPKDPVDYLGRYLQKYADTVRHLEEAAQEAEQLRIEEEEHMEEIRLLAELEQERRHLEEEERQREAAQQRELEEQKRAEEEARLKLTLATVREEDEARAAAEKVAEDAQQPTDESAEEGKLSTLTEQDEPLDSAKGEPTDGVPTIAEPEAEEVVENEEEE